MPHDVNGQLISEGDLVLVPCRVKSVTVSTEYCNASLVACFPMPPYSGDYGLSINTQQCIRTTRAALDQLVHTLAAETSEAKPEPA